MSQRLLPSRRARRTGPSSLVLAILLVAAPALAKSEKEGGAPGVAPASPQQCALLDNPKIAGRLDGLLVYLATACGREAEFLGGVRQEVDFPGENFSPEATDVAINDQTQDSAGSKFTQSETSIAFNETTGTLCASWNDSYSGVTLGTGYSGFGRSTDGGVTFTDRGDFPTVNYGDPSLVWRRSDGKFYYAALSSTGGLVLYRSDDDCLNFVQVGAISSTGNDDKEIMTVDNNPSSPYYGRLYVAWTDFTDGRINLRKSSNGGTTWDAAIDISAADDVQGAWPAVAPNGDVYVAWVRWNPYPSGPIDIQVTKSTDGGATFNLVTAPMSGKTNPRDGTATSSCGRPALKGNIRYLPSPTIAVDGAGNLHIVYSYDPDATGSGDVINVYYRRSTNGGTSWDPEIQINDDATTTDQWQPSLSVGVGNVVTVGYYSRQLDPGGNTLFDYYSRTSFNGGASFEASVRLSDVSSAVVLDTNLATCYHGDYDTQTHGAGFAHYLWSDDRDPAGAPAATPNVYTDVTPAGTDFLPIAQTASQTVCAPNDGVYAIDVLKFLTFAESVTLSATGNPANSTVGFSVNGQVPPFASTMTVDVTGSTPAGSSTITVTGTSSPGGIVHSTTVGLTVFTAAPAAATLLAPADGAIDQPRGPALSWSAVPNTVDYTVEVATDAGFTNIVRTQSVAGTSWAVAPQLDINTDYYWRVTANNACGSAVSGVFDFRTANPSILLVDDDDNGPDVRPTYDAMLGPLAVYDVWDTAGGEPTLTDLIPYRAVVWFTGDRFCSSTSPCTGPQTAAETALGQYLDAGRCLFIASQDYLWDMGGSGHNTATPFMASYLGLASATSDSGDYTRVDGANAYAAFPDQTLAYPYSDYSDILVLGSGAQEAFRGDTGSTNLGAISKLTANYFTTFSSFGLEALPSASRTPVLTQFMTVCDDQVPLFRDDFEIGSTNRWALTVQP